VDDKSFIRTALVTVALATSVVTAREAAADEPQQDKASDAPAPFRPHFIGDLRAMAIIRTDNNYFAHANTYSYSVDPGAGDPSRAARLISRSGHRSPA